MSSCTPWEVKAMLKNIQTFPSKEGNSPKLAETNEILLQVKKKTVPFTADTFPPRFGDQPQWPFTALGKHGRLL